MVMDYNMDSMAWTKLCIGKILMSIDEELENY